MTRHELPPRDFIIRTPNGIYVPPWAIEKIGARGPDGMFVPQSTADAPTYRVPDMWSGIVGDFLGTPVFVLPAPVPAPAPRPRWWVRAWRWLTRRRFR